MPNLPSDTMALTKAQRIALLLVLTAIIGVSLFALSTRAVVPGTADRVAFSPAADQPRPILIDVEGAVAYPGLYWVPVGTRVNEALGRAGGARGDGDTTALSMAALVHDGERVFVPVRTPRPQPWQTPAGVNSGSVQPLPVRPEAPRPTTGRSHMPQQPEGPLVGTVNLNTAPPEVLARLPRIGPKMAARIVEYRALHGPFRNYEDLDAVPGIGPETIRALGPYVTF